MKWKIILPLLTAIVALSSCTNESEVKTSTSPLVVEAYLHVNHPFVVTVSNLTGVQGMDVDEVAVSISESGFVHQLMSKGNGVYESDESEKVEANHDEYTLKIEYQSHVISSLTIVPSKPENFTISKTEMIVEPIQFGGGFPGGGINVESVELTWNNPSEEYFFVFFQNIEDDPELINSSLDTVDGNAPRLFFRGEPTQGSSTTISSRQFQYYGRYNVILFHVNPDYAALYKEQENSSSLNLTSPFTNIVNGLGIFTAIHSDTLLLTVKKQ